MKKILNSSFLSLVPSFFRSFFLLFLCVSNASCLYLLKPRENFESSKNLSRPDYSDLKYWASHPAKKDPGDEVPKDSGFTDMQATAEADVFFVHPTTLIVAGKYWNGDLEDESLNRKTEEGPIRSQAGAFNECCRVYAPRYRQAAFYVFMEDTPEGQKALDFAYEDVKNAFLYYMKNLNQGRPWILASHSQGTRHTVRLLKEIVSSSSYKKNLVAAYSVGYPYSSEETGLSPCISPDALGCVINWNSFLWGSKPVRLSERFGKSLCVNPLSWTVDESYQPKESNPGSVPIRFYRVLPGIADAKCESGILWVHEPESRGFPILGKDDTYHLVDYHLFYASIRRNAKARVDKFLSEKGKR